MTGKTMMMLVGALLGSASAAPAMAQAPAPPLSQIAAVTPAPSPVFSGGDLFNLSYASDPQVSPDGKRIAYVRMSADVMSDRYRPSIWLIDTATGRQEPLVAGSGAHSSPRWSPDGRRLAYVSTSEGPGAQLFVKWLDSGQAARITGLPDGPSDIAWSSDGRRIAYLMRVPGEGPSIGKAPPKPEGATWAEPLQVIDRLQYRNDGSGNVRPGFEQLFVIDADGGAPRRLTSGGVPLNGPLDWAGDSIILSGNRSPSWEREPVESNLLAVDSSTGAVTELTRRKGPEGSASVSPDGRTIAFLGFEDDGQAYNQAGLYLMNRDGSDMRRIASEFDRSIDNVQWSGNQLVIGFEEKGHYRLARVSTAGAVSPLPHDLAAPAVGRPYTGGAWSVARDGTIAFTSGSASRPTDISVARGNSARRLTALNDLWLSGKRLGEVRTLDAKAADGTPVPGWILLPAGYQEGQKVPTILEIHGGPYTSYGPYFSTDYQLFAAAGYAVLFPNVRGSTGYGEAFADGIEKSYPTPNETDLMASIDAAVAAGFADPDNLFITGGSGGGLLTAWMTGHTNRFKAAAVQKPVINWTSQALVADGVGFFGRYWLGAEPWEQPEKYWQRSPLSLAGKVKTPTLVIVGGDDLRTPNAEAEQWYSALRVQGVPAMLVKVPGASHSLDGRPSQAAARASAITAWFDRYRTRK
ncbi:dipeptidyl aminopeptidase/acylaminoacyl peptidase [Sphingomonas kaistensis]|uniref:Dipeptidyl aminopeptidase/acylaminoacyl peptidase n=1 Tax=Sphingomonas kaistensis TaxID=298708 RepID=A0A7X5Y9L9_9SPHN|nr:S9 family peptidase [Sphingomonas kaistensis]NJC06056.1 dipeptidyl aminopeptidase/acylaminoacyl peptidase [Sphingomonas kaistensis]